MMELSSDSEDEAADTVSGGNEGMRGEEDADDTVLVDTSSMECVGSLIGHNASVNSMAMVGSDLITASSDATVAIWSPDPSSDAMV